MLITKKHIMVNLEKLYPDLKFNEKYKEYFIEKIKEFFINDLNIKIKKTEKKEDIYALIEEFSFLIERTDKSFESMYKIDDDLIERNKDNLLKSLYPEYIKEKKTQTLSKEEAALLISLYLHIQIKFNNTYNELFKNKYGLDILNIKEILLYFKKNLNSKSLGSYSELKDTRSIRNLFNLAKEIYSYNRDELFEIRVKHALEFKKINSRYIYIGNIMDYYSTTLNSLYEGNENNELYIDITNEINIIENNISLIIKRKENNTFINYKEITFNVDEISLSLYEKLKKDYEDLNYDIEKLKILFKQIEVDENNNFYIKKD